jgi:hypothetical protein
VLGTGRGGSAVKLKGIRIPGVKMKDGRLVVQKSYASVSDKLKRGDKRKIVRGKRI